MKIGIETLNLINETDGISLEEGVAMENGTHKLLKIKLGHKAHMGIEVYLRSFNATNEIKQKAKWIWAVKDKPEDSWKLLSWTGKGKLPIKINGESTTDYADSPTVLITSDNEQQVGKLYWLEAFIHYPEMPEAAIPKGVYFTFVDSPTLKDACFTDKGFCDFSSQEKQYVPVTQYGKKINLFIQTYKIPDPRVGYHNYGVFKVLIFSKKKGEAVDDELVFEQLASGTEGYLGASKISILISEDWRKKIDHQPKEIEEFYAEVTPVLYENKNATLASEAYPHRPYGLGGSRETYTETTAPNKEAVRIRHYRPKTMTPFGMYNTGRAFNRSKDYEQTELPTEKTTNTFKVLYNTGQEIQLERQEKVGEQMASILDTKHECIPNNYACKYTSITINEKEKEVYTVLEEKDSGEVEDNTNRIFGVIAGDTKKSDVIITLKELTHAGSSEPVECLSIGGTKHESSESVFAIDDDVLSALSITKEDFTIEDNKLTLSAKYRYNRNYESRAQKWLGSAANTISGISNLKVSDYDIAWVVRYFIMRDEHAQPYFIPVQTCRYPNQLVRFNVYPDFEWWVNFKYNAKNPVHVRQTPNYGYRVFTTKKNQNQKNAGALRTDRANAKKWEYKFEFEAGFSQNGVKEELKLADGFPLINAVNFILKAYDLKKKLTFADETKEKEASIAAGAARTSENTAAKSMSRRYRQRKSKGFPFRIEVSRPSISGGIHGKYAYSETQKGSVGKYYSIQLAANPLFGVTGKVDLLYFAQFIGPIGQAMHRISQVVKRVNYLTLGAVHIDYYLYIAAEVQFNLSVDALEYHSIDGYGGGDLASQIDIKFWLEAGVNVEVNIQGVGGGEASAVVRGEAKMHVNIFHEKNTNKSEGLFKFDGLSAKIWVKLQARQDESSVEEDNPTDPHGRPTAVKKILDAASPWKINILR